MTQEQHDAIWYKKIDELNTLVMIKEKWYPADLPLKDGKIDFVKFEELWNLELERRRMDYIQNALMSDSYDAYASDGKTPNIDGEIKSFSSRK